MTGQAASGERGLNILVIEDETKIAEFLNDLPHVFEPFYRSDRSRSRRRGGSGLGLAVVRAIVQAHGGTIEVESELGQGARFRIILPRVNGFA